MIVVSDTSVITALIQIHRIDLLAKIFGGVVIPQAVAAELAVSHLKLPAWIRVEPVGDKQIVESLILDLDAGESEAIALALELGADFLLMDEKLGELEFQDAFSRSTGGFSTGFGMSQAVSHSCFVRLKPSSSRRFSISVKWAAP